VPPPLAEAWSKAFRIKKGKMRVGKPYSPIESKPYLYDKDFKAEQKRQTAAKSEISKSPTEATHQVTGEKMAEQKPATIGNLDNNSDINSDLNIRRKRLAEKVIKLFDKNGYVFGGYLRDEVAGVPFTDVDIFFPSRNVGYERAFDSIVVSELKRANLAIIDLGEKRTYVEPKEFEDENGKKRKNRNRDHFMVRQFELEDRMIGTTVRFDMVFGSLTGGVNRDFPFVAGLDADVNCLWRDKNGQLRVAPNIANKTTVDEVKKNIINRVFVPMDDEVRKERLNKLIAKGYKAATKVSAVSEKSDKKEQIMSKDNTSLTFMEQFKKDAENASYQSVGTQVTKAAKEGLLAAMKAHGADDGAVAGLTKLLDTPAGEAAISALLGHGLPHAPMIGDDERVQRLAEQMRVNGYAACMNIIFNVVMQYMLPGITAALEKLPAPSANTAKKATKARIAAKNAEHEAEEEAEAEHETAASARSKKAA